MPSVTCTLEADVATWSSGIAAGAGPHLPVGYWSSAHYRSALRFTPPAWSGWVSITKATLTIKTTDFAHVGPRNSGIYIRRQNESALWTKGQGTQNCNSGFSGSNTTQYDDIAPTSTDQVSLNTGTAENSVKSINVLNLVKYYWTNAASKIVFVLDAQGTDDYAEFWSDDTSGRATLTIDYTVSTPPGVPVLGDPAEGSVQGKRPTFNWTHTPTDGDPQLEATIHLTEETGPTVSTIVVPGAASSYTPTTDLNTWGLPVAHYAWKVQTKDKDGYSAYSATKRFTIPGDPTLLIDPVRQMTFCPTHRRPELIAEYHANNMTPTEVRLQANTTPPYDTGWTAGPLTEQVVHAPVVDNTPVLVTVSVRDGSGTTVTDTETFNPRYGLTTHRRDLTAAPSAWVSGVVTGTIPIGADLKVEYGSDPAVVSVPESGWLDDIADCPLNRYVYWRAWFIPSATAGPTLDKIVINSQTGAAAALDKWSTVLGGSTFGAPWAADTAEYVYGSRSVRCNVTGAGPLYLYSQPITLRANRSYILTGLMKSQLDSGAQIVLMDEFGTILNRIEDGAPVVTDILHATTLFYTPDRLDVLRYKTPVYRVGGADKTVYVALRAGGVAGARAWFDAVKLEESTVATAWSPGALGATIVDAGGVQIDASKGGVFRLRGSAGGARDTVELGVGGLLLGGDTEVTSPADGSIAVDGVAVSMAGHAHTPIVRVYTSGTNTWTKPAGLVAVMVECIGGGGAGGGCLATGAGQASVGGGGGGGGYARKTFAASLLPTSCTVTVGAGGTAVSGAAGNAGGTSSFSGTGITTVQGNGGGGGDPSAATTGYGSALAALGGAASGGDMNARGGAGSGSSVVAGNRLILGIGGPTAFGGGGLPGNDAAGAGGGGYGGGGGGATRGPSLGALAGGAGAAGVVIVTEFY